MLTDDIENQGDCRCVEATGRSRRAQMPNAHSPTGIAPLSDPLIHAVVSGPLTRAPIAGESTRRASAAGGGRLSPTRGGSTTGEGATTGGGRGRASTPITGVASRGEASSALPVGPTSAGLATGRVVIRPLASVTVNSPDASPDMSDGATDPPGQLQGSPSRAVDAINASNAMRQESGSVDGSDPARTGTHEGSSVAQDEAAVATAPRITSAVMPNLARRRVPLAMIRRARDPHGVFRTTRLEPSIVNAIWLDLEANSSPEIRKCVARRPCFDLISIRVAKVCMTSCEVYVEA